MAPSSKVNLWSHCQKAHLLEVTLIPAKFETDCLQSKGITGQKKLCKWEVTTQKWKVNQKSHSQKGISIWGDIDLCQVWNWLAVQQRNYRLEEKVKEYIWGSWHQGQRSVKSHTPKRHINSTVKEVQVGKGSGAYIQMDGCGSKVKGQSMVTPQKAHVLDMTYKYEIDGLHSQGTTGQKRKWVQRTYGQTALTEYNMAPIPLAGDIIKERNFFVSQLINIVFKME